jgi:hypothetical protein
MYEFKVEKDMGGQDESKSQIVPGWHKAKIVNILDTPSKKGNEMLTFVWEISNGINIRQWIVMEHENKNVVYFSKKKIIKMKECLIGDAEEGETINVQEFLGKSCFIDVQMKFDKEKRNMLFVEGVSKDDPSIFIPIEPVKNVLSTNSTINNEKPSIEMINDEVPF